MLQSYGDTQKLFAKSVPVTVKDGFTNQCRKCALFLTVEWKEASAAVNKQELLVSLTDSNDPFFLYHLHLSEEDFQVLKSSQGLLVDFTAFPQKFIDLIETCLAEEDKASPKFLLVFNTSDKVGSISPASQLDVVETNPFKHLIHLTLKFIAATDSSVKQYLAVTLKNLKEEKQQLEAKLSYLEQDSRSRLSSTHASLEQKSQELERLKNELTVQLNSRETRHAKELQEEREKFLNKQREIEIRCERDKKDKEYNFSKELQNFESRVSCLDSLNKELKDQNHKRDTTIQELKSCMSSLESEKRRLKEGQQEYKERNQELQSELKQKVSEISIQKEKLQDLEKNKIYMTDMMNKLQEQYDKYRDWGKEVEFDRSELQKELKESKRVIKCHQADIDKGNEVIAKYQRQIQVSHEELKEGHFHAEDLQRSIASKDKTIRAMQKELKDVKQNLGKRRDEVEHLSDSVTTLQETISTLEIKMKEKDNVIRYLNRQFAEKCIIPQYLPTSNQEQSSPINEKRHSAGDAEVINLGRSPSTDVTEKHKTLSGRNGNSSHLPNNAINSPNQIPFDSAYSSTPCNTSNSVNPNTGNFELDSDALSAAFGAGDVPKHSTAKKFVYSRTGKVFRGGIKK